MRQWMFLGFFLVSVAVVVTLWIDRKKDTTKVEAVADDGRPATLDRPPAAVAPSSPQAVVGGGPPKAPDTTAPVTAPAAGNIGAPPEAGGIPPAFDSYVPPPAYDPNNAPTYPDSFGTNAYDPGNTEPPQPSYDGIPADDQVVPPPPEGAPEEGF